MAKSKQSRAKQEEKRKKNHAKSVERRRLHKGTILRQESEVLVKQFSRIVDAFELLVTRMPEDHKNYLTTMPEYVKLKTSLDTNKQIIEEIRTILEMSDQELMDNEMILKTKFMELGLHQQNITSSMQASGKMLDSALNDGKIHKALDVSEDLLPSDPTDDNDELVTSQVAQTVEVSNKLSAEFIKQEQQNIQQYDEKFEHLGFIPDANSPLPIDVLMADVEREAQRSNEAAI